VVRNLRQFQFEGTTPLSCDSLQKSRKGRSARRAQPGEWNSTFVAFHARLLEAVAVEEPLVHPVLPQRLCPPRLVSQLAPRCASWHTTTSSSRGTAMPTSACAPACRASCHPVLPCADCLAILRTICGNVPLVSAASIRALALVLCTCCTCLSLRRKQRQRQRQRCQPSQDTTRNFIRAGRGSSRLWAGCCTGSSRTGSSRPADHHAILCIVVLILVRVIVGPSLRWRHRPRVDVIPPRVVLRGCPLATYATSCPPLLQPSYLCFPFFPVSLIFPQRRAQQAFKERLCFKVIGHCLGCFALSASTLAASSLLSGR